MEIDFYVAQASEVILRLSCSATELKQCVIWLKHDRQVITDRYWVHEGWKKMLNLGCHTKPEPIQTEPMPLFNRWLNLAWNGLNLDKNLDTTQLLLFLYSLTKSTNKTKSLKDSVREDEWIYFKPGANFWSSE